MRFFSLIHDIIRSAFSRKRNLTRCLKMGVPSKRTEDAGPLHLPHDALLNGSLWIRSLALLLCVALISISWIGIPANYSGNLMASEESRLKTAAMDDVETKSEATLPINEIPQEPKLSHKLSYSYADGKTVEFHPGTSGFGLKKIRGDTSYHPLSLERTTLLDLEEIAIGNLRETGVGSMWVFDDKHNDIRKLHTGEFAAENLGGSDMVAGDLDGDGRDEIVISSELDFLEEEVPVSMTQVAFFDDATTNFKLLNSSVFWITSCSLTSGDFDGDSIDEVAMVGNHLGNVSMAGVIFDDLLASEPVYHLWNPINGGWEASFKPTIHHDIVAGDFDGDSRDELATVGYYNDTLISWIWSWNNDTGDNLPTYNGMDHVYTLPEMRFTKGQPSLATGEIDGDNRDELIVTTHDEDWKIHYWIYDDLQTNFEILKDVRDNITIRSTESATGDIDGDGLDEIFLVGHRTAHLIGRVLDDANHDYALLKVLDYVPDDKWFYWFNVKVKTGDIDGDGFDEYAILGQSYVYLYGELHDDLGPGNAELLKEWRIGDNKLPSLAIGDFDGDGLILEYTGKHEIFETPSIPIVAMAAPPVMEGLNPDSEESYTRFGITRPNGLEKAYQLDLSTELAISFEGEPIELSNGQRSALLREFEKTETPVGVNSNNISFEGYYPGDYIIYQNTVFDQYSYRILSWPGHDDRVGENISINVPITINFGHETLSEYNARDVNSQVIDIEDFRHQSGKISTYPDSEERDTTLDRYPGWRSESVFIGQGAGISMVSIDLGEELNNEQMLRYGTSWSHLEGLVGRFETTVGLSSDLLHEVTIGKYTRFEGRLENQNEAEESEKWNYSFGMFVYKKDRLEDGLVYLVINYWVDENESSGSENIEYYGYWTFDTLVDSNLTIDLSQNHNNATVNGATLTEGIKNMALHFDGIDDEVEMQFDLPPNNFTIELWLKTNMTDIGLFSILEDSESIDGHDHNFYLKNGKPHLLVGSDQAWSTNVSLTDGLWHYWVWTIENDVGQKLYIDGELVGVNSFDQSDFDLGDRIRIGHSSAGAQPYFEGDIDEVKVHQRTLNATLIAENFEAVANDSSTGNGQDIDDDGDDNEYLITFIFLLICIGGVMIMSINKIRKDKTK